MFVALSASRPSGRHLTARYGPLWVRLKAGMPQVNHDIVTIAYIFFDRLVNKPLPVVFTASQTRADYNSVLCRERRTV
jgi:hypothetical protein